MTDLHGPAWTSAICISSSVLGREPDDRYDVQVWQKDGSGNISSFPQPALVGSAGVPVDGTGWRPPVRRRY